MRLFQTIVMTPYLLSIILRQASGGRRFYSWHALLPATSNKELPTLRASMLRTSRKQSARLAFQGSSSSHTKSLTARYSHRCAVRPAIVPFSDSSFSRDSQKRPVSLTSFSRTFLRATSTTNNDGINGSGDKSKKPSPTILLAGFLGSGKTSTLKHLLENNQSIKIGTIVNDVAAVNIDAKLIVNSNSKNLGNGNDGTKGSTSTGAAEAVVELQNGCACCSLADELLSSVVLLTQGGKRELDAIVVELSGVADPMAVKDNWEQAKLVSRLEC